MLILRNIFFLSSKAGGWFLRGRRGLPSPAPLPLVWLRQILDEKLLSNSHYNNPEGFFQIGTSPFYLL